MGLKLFHNWANEKPLCKCNPESHIAEKGANLCFPKIEFTDEINLKELGEEGKAENKKEAYSKNRP